LRGQRRPSGGKVRAGTVESLKYSAPHVVGDPRGAAHAVAPTPAPSVSTRSRRRGHKNCRGPHLLIKDSRVFHAHDKGLASGPCPFTAALTTDFIDPTVFPQRLELGVAGAGSTPIVPARFTGESHR